MAERKRKIPWLRAAYLAILAVFYASSVVGRCGNGGTTVVSMAATSVSGLLIGPGLVFALVFAVQRKWSDLAVSTVLTLAYFPLSGQFVWSPQSPEADRSKTLRVMSFNIEHGRKGVERVADAVRSQDIDVFAFQECSGIADMPSYSQLEALLPEYRFVSDGSRASGSRLPLVSSRIHKLTPYEYSWTMIELVVDFHGKPVRVLNVHAPSYLPEATLERPVPDWFRRWGGLSREQQALVDKELQIVGQSELPSVLCGDFNMTPGCSRYETLAKRATDAFAASGRGTGWTSPSGFPIRRIDFVWTFPGVTPVDCYVVDRHASDHAAVVAALLVR